MAQAKKSAEKRSIQVDDNIILTKKNHDDLVSLLKDKLQDQKPFHEAQVEKFTAIDKAVYGYLILDEQDKKRAKDNKRGYGIKPVDTSLPLVLVQLDEAVTYFLEVLGTDGGLYGAIAPKEKQPVATGFASLMNEHADRFGHERALNKFLFDAMKYNLGGLSPYWKVLHGNKIENDLTGAAEIKEGVVYSGNALSAIDPYNTFYDLSVDPCDVSMKGEFFAEAEIPSVFRVRKMVEDGELFNMKDLLDRKQFSINWYTPKPKIRAEYLNVGRTSNWFEMLGGTGASASDKVIELVCFHIWLPTAEYGISNSKKMEICRVILANNERIARIQVLNNAHAMLPLSISMPWEDGFKQETKSYGELLMPFQTFASSQMNIHQKASRKALYGVTLYNKNVINLDDEYDPIASKIGVNLPPSADLNAAFRQIFDAPKTENTLRDIEAVAALMQKVLPTEILRQVAGLDRATQYQAAATVQGANRRNLKVAKIINSQGISPVKHMQMYNIFQYQESVEILTQEGELIEINPKEFRDTKLEFTISEGLKGLDKLSISMAIKDVLGMIVQSQQASAQIDVVSLLNYWTSMIGDKTDFSQFKFKSEIDKLPPEQKDLAFQLLQQFMQQQQTGAGA